MSSSKIHRHIGEMHSEHLSSNWMRRSKILTDRSVWVSPWSTITWEMFTVLVEISFRLTFATLLHLKALLVGPKFQDDDAIKKSCLSPKAASSFDIGIQKSYLAMRYISIRKVNYGETKSKSCTFNVKNTEHLLIFTYC